MILDNRLLLLRLRDEPEFATRLEELVSYRKIRAKPVLVLQVRPAPGRRVTVDLDRADLLERFRSGHPGHRNWWDGFSSGVSPQPTFHGVAGLPSGNDPDWTTEVHRDGHMLAAVWRFPEMDRGAQKVLAIADFYADCFVQFFAHAAAVLEVGGASGAFSATTTLLNAGMLHFASRNWGGMHVATGNPVPLDHLQWPVSVAELGSSEWDTLTASMTTGLFGAYGYRREG